MLSASGISDLHFLKVCDQSVDEGQSLLLKILSFPDHLVTDRFYATALTATPRPRTFFGVPPVNVLTESTESTPSIELIPKYQGHISDRFPFLEAELTRFFSGLDCFSFHGEPVQLSRLFLEFGGHNLIASEIRSFSG